MLPQSFTKTFPVSEASLSWSIIKSEPTWYPDTESKVICVDPFVYPPVTLWTVPGLPTQAREEPAIHILACCVSHPTDAQQASMCIAGSSRAWVGNPGTVHNVTGGYTKGSTQITLDSVSGYQVGSLLIMDQLNDASDTGNVFVNDCGNIYLTGCTTSYGQEGNSPGRSGPPDRNQQQFFVITAISATTVAISSPVYM